MNETILEHLKNNKIDFTFTSDDYLILHDYNDSIIEYLDNNKIDYYHDDSSTTCSNCYCHIDLYNYHRNEGELLNDCEIVCNDCIKNNFQQEYLCNRINEPKKAIRDYIISHSEMIDEYGYKKLDEEYNTGLYEWSNDDPSEIYEKIKNDYDSIVFMITDQNPFNVRYSCYVK